MFCRNMAPFKLKFRMGSNASHNTAAQDNAKDNVKGKCKTKDNEVEENVNANANANAKTDDRGVKQDDDENEHEMDEEEEGAAFFIHHNHRHHNIGSMAASTTTIDSTDCHSLGSLGVLNQSGLSTTTTSTTTETNLLSTLTPPFHQFSLEQQECLTSNKNEHLYDSQTTLLESSTNFNNIMMTCTDPNCPENCNQYTDYAINGKNFSSNDDNNDNDIQCMQHINRNSSNTSNCNLTMNCLNELDDRKESIDSQELLLSNTNTINMTEHDVNQTNCTDESCQEYRENNAAAASRRVNSMNQLQLSGHDDTNEHHTSHEFCDPLINYNDYYNESSDHCNINEHHHEQQQHQQQQQQQQIWNTNDGTYLDMAHNHHHHQQQQQQRLFQINDENEYQQQHQHQQQQYEHQSQYSAMLSAQTKSDYSMISTDITSNKSSKEIYKNLAKQCGITCKMSDGCRCMECQSHYFDCEFDENEHQKTDGGLGAGTPMFISEVMHGTACNVL